MLWFFDRFRSHFTLWPQQLPDAALGFSCTRRYAVSEKLKQLSPLPGERFWSIYYKNVFGCCRWKPYNTQCTRWSVRRSALYPCRLATCRNKCSYQKNFDINNNLYCIIIFTILIKTLTHRFLGLVLLSTIYQIFFYKHLNFAFCFKLKLNLQNNHAYNKEYRMWESWVGVGILRRYRYIAISLLRR